MKVLIFIAMICVTSKLTLADDIEGEVVDNKTGVWYEVTLEKNNFRTFLLKQSVTEKLLFSFPENKSIESFQNNNHTLKYIPDNISIKLPSLIWIKIANASLQEVHKNHFENLINLTVIDLSLNDLTTIEEGLFANNSKLQLINLENNKIAYFHANAFASNAKDVIKFIQLENNTCCSQKFQNRLLGSNNESHFETFIDDLTNDCPKIKEKKGNIKVDEKCRSCAQTEELKELIQNLPTNNLSLSMSLGLNVIQALLIIILVIALMRVKTIMRVEHIPDNSKNYEDASYEVIDEFGIRTKNNESDYDEVQNVGIDVDYEEVINEGGCNDVDYEEILQDGEIKQMPVYASVNKAAKTNN